MQVLLQQALRPQAGQDSRRAGPLGAVDHELRHSQVEQAPVRLVMGGDVLAEPLEVGRRVSVEKMGLDRATLADHQVDVRSLAGQALGLVDHREGCQRAPAHARRHQVAGDAHDR